MATTQILTTYLDAARGGGPARRCRARRLATALHASARRARFDLVTDADLASQQAIQEYLGGRFPGPCVSSARKTDRPRQGPVSDAPPTWIVDPLDGTTNYVHDCPLYCVSIGLQVAGELVVGVVYEPSRNEMFAAAQGLGAWLGDRRLQTSRAERLEEALVATGFPPDLRRPGTHARLVASFFVAHAVAAPHRFDGAEPGLCRGRAVRRLLGVRQSRLGRRRRDGAGPRGWRRHHQRGRQFLRPVHARRARQQWAVAPGAPH